MYNKAVCVGCHLEGSRESSWLLAPWTVAPLELGRAKSVCSLISLGTDSTYILMLYIGTVLCINVIIILNHLIRF